MHRLHAADLRANEREDLPLLPLRCLGPCYYSTCVLCLGPCTEVPPPCDSDADSDFQTLHLGPPAEASKCEWCSLGSAAGFLDSVKQWQAQAARLGFEINPLVFPFGPSDPILLQPEPTEPHGSIHNLVEPIKFTANFQVEPQTETEVQGKMVLTLVDSMAAALQNPSFDPPAGDGQQFAHWVQDKPGNRSGLR